VLPLNSKQKKVLVGAALVMVLMVLFPPFEYVGQSGRVLGDGGYSFVGAHPTRMINSQVSGRVQQTATVNYKMLLLQMAMAGVVGVVGFAVLKD